MTTLVPRLRRAAIALGPERAFALGGFLLAYTFAWILSAPAIVPLINWDTGSYVAAIATGKHTWSSVPWNSHLGMGQEYLLGGWIAKAFGGTLMDGARVIGALAFAAAFVIIADTLRILTRGYLLATLLAMAWATAWVNLHYHLLIEDNMMFLAPGAGVLRICVLRGDAWRWRDSVACGALVLVGYLGSFQGLMYLAPPMWAAMIGQRRTGWARTRDTLLVPAAAFVALMLWAVFSVVMSDLGWRVLMKTIFSRPDPSFLPRTMAELIHIFKDAVILDTLGTGVAYHLTFSAYKLAVKPPLSTVAMGALALAVQCALFVGGTIWAWRRRELRIHLLTGMMLLFTVVTSLHKDLAEYAELKRFDFVPLYLVFLAGAVLAAVRLRPRQVGVLAALLTVVIVAQTVLGLRWAERERATYVTTKPWSALPQPMHQLYGRDRKGWFGYFRALRATHPKACRFVFVASELNSGWWNFDLIATLWSELPDHLLIGPPGLKLDRPLTQWRYPVKYATVVDARNRGLLGGCAWLSEDARKLVEETPP